MDLYAPTGTFLSKPTHVFDMLSIQGVRYEILIRQLNIRPVDINDILKARKYASHIRVTSWQMLLQKLLFYMVVCIIIIFFFVGEITF